MPHRNENGRVVIRWSEILSTSLFLVFFASMWQGRLSRDPLVSIVDIACMVILPIAAFFASRSCRRFLVFTVFGCLGMAPLIANWWSIASRDAWAWSDTQLKWLIGACTLGMAASAVVCRLAAMLGMRFWDRNKTQEPLCSTCGYNLTGNVSGICPECGKAIVPAADSGD